MNAAQRAAVVHGFDDDRQPGSRLDASAAAATVGNGKPRDSSAIVPGPLLIVAGAGTGKTKTLAHRVAYAILCGADPRRVLLLTFTRRAAHEMTTRARRICATHARRGHAAELPIPWSGTFHSVANRLLRLHGAAIGLDPSFTVVDRADAEDLLNLVRDELGFSARATRFPKKASCLAIYSHTVNAQCALAATLAAAFPWCAGWEDELRALFGAYVDAKQARNVLDYDDLLLYWHHLMAQPAAAAAVRGRFDHVLVDEYQDTNALQATMLYALAPDGIGLTVVGDDAQAIFSFRAATVANMREFPQHFATPAAVVMLEENYRSTQPILDACNAVNGLATDGFVKRLFSSRRSRQKPVLTTTEDEAAEAEYVAEQVLAHREAGVALKRQAVLFRAAHHSDQLEVELGRRNVPFVKFGGLKFLEAAHVKDLLCVLRWVENPRDTLAAFRVLQLLPGMGPAGARAALAHLDAHHGDLRALRRFRPPPSTAHDWPALCALVVALRDGRMALQEQVAAVRRWYQPHLERIYDAARVRAGDLEQLEQLAAGYPSRERFLTELTLDAPSASGDHAGAPHLDDDYLILSTIHSAKGQEWDVVYVLHVVDGCIPSDMASGGAAEIEEERRLLYVAMTRARDHLYLVQPLRFYAHEQHRHGARHVYAPRTRFLPDAVLDAFERRVHAGTEPGDAPAEPVAARGIDAAARVRAMWK
ncbi:MAG: ATP-dependent helicase, partial [Deltaproteobacteria bacterium]